MGDKKYSSPRARAEAFTGALGIRLPILLAPMAGACPPSLSIAVANAGGLGACGTLLMEPQAIKAWSAEFRRQSQGEFQLNLWIPEPVPVREFESEKQHGSICRRGDLRFQRKRAMPCSLTLRHNAKP
jgi:nitronate monooxygenase